MERDSFREKNEEERFGRESGGWLGCQAARWGGEAAGVEVGLVPQKRVRNNSGERVESGWVAKLRKGEAEGVEEGLVPQKRVRNNSGMADFGLLILGCEYKGVSQAGTVPMCQANITEERPVKEAGRRLQSRRIFSCYNIDCTREKFNVKGVIS